MAQPLWLRIEGARQNNLKNVSLDIPHDRVTVVTGVSGSGKSSLAFDTIFAEGQWRYIESLSAYARMFLERLDRPDVDRIEHIRPAIALEQKNPVRTARSTVGTATELHDYLRLLFAKVGRVHCPTCGSEARSDSAERVADELIRDRPSARALVCFPLPAAPRPDARAFLATLVQRGFARIKVGDLVLDLAEAQVPGVALPPLDGQPLQVVLDRVTLSPDGRRRITESIETALVEGEGRAIVDVMGHAAVHVSREFRCPRCDVAARAPPARALLLQPSARSLSRVQGLRQHSPLRRDAGGPRPVPQPGRGRGRAVVPSIRTLVPEAAHQGGEEAGRGRDAALRRARPERPGVDLRGGRRSHGHPGLLRGGRVLPLQAPRASLPLAIPQPVAVPSLQRGAAQARGAQRHGGWRHHRRLERQNGGGPQHLSRRALILVVGRGGGTGSPQAPARQALLPPAGRARLSHPRPADADAVRRGSPAHQSRQSAGSAAGGHPLRARRAVDRTARAGHRAPRRALPRAGARGQYRDHRGARSLLYRVRRLSDRDGARARASAEAR